MQIWTLFHHAQERLPEKVWIFHNSESGSDTWSCHFLWVTWFFHSENASMQGSSTTDFGVKDTFWFLSSWGLLSWAYSLYIWDLVISSMGFPGGSDGKESACSAGNLGSIPGLGRSPGEGSDYPLQYSCLENSMDKGAWQTTAHGISKSRPWLREWHFHCFLYKWESKYLAHNIIVKIQGYDVYVHTNRHSRQDGEKMITWLS